jgi:hypothetical protein
MYGGSFSPEFKIGDHPMSKSSGDMARYHRIRKHRIAKRATARALRAAIEAKKSGATPKV